MASMIRQIQGDAAGKVAQYAFLALIMLTVLFPSFIALITSLKPQSQVYTSPPTWLPSRFRFGNNVDMFHQVALGQAFLNSFIISAGATIIVLACALPAGYALARYDFPGRRVFLFAILSIIMFSPIVIVISLFQIMASYNLIDNWYAVSLADATFALPFSIWLMTGYLETIPRELDEAALIDGCSPLRTFVQILLPLALPGVATVLIFGFVQSWNEFLLATSLLTSGDKYPLPVAMFNFVGAHGVQWQYVTGAVVLSTLPVVLLFLTVQRFLVRGLTVGAVK
jgi:multiple sugar transport system permease protein